MHGQGQQRPQTEDLDPGLVKDCPPLGMIQLRVAHQRADNAQGIGQHHDGRDSLGQPVGDPVATKTCHCSYHSQTPSRTATATETTNTTRELAIPSAMLCPTPMSMIRWRTPAAT